MEVFSSGKSSVASCNSQYSIDMHRRRSIRLEGYDYSQTGAYFVTICAKDRECIFEEYSKLKNIVERQWKMIPALYGNVDLDEYVIMPNHFHGILVLTETMVDAGEGRKEADTTYKNRTTARAGASPAPTVGAPLAGACFMACAAKSIGDIIGAFKSLVSVEWLKIIKAENINARGRFWQRNYYEHIIRDDEELNRVREYIINNPAQWAEDEDNPVNIKQQLNIRRHNIKLKRGGKDV